MKTTNHIRYNRISILFSLTALLHCTIISNAQVRVSTTGSVSVGDTTANPSGGLKVYGGDLNLNSTSSSFKINGNKVLFNDSNIENIFVGYGAGGSSHMTGLKNTFSGYTAGYSNTSGNHNSALGGYAFYTNTTGHGNIALGSSTLYQNISGNLNTACGMYALYSNNYGSNSTAMGYQSFYYNTGSENTAVGYWAGLTNTTGTSNTFLGSRADAFAGNYTNATAIGYGAIVTGSNRVQLGNSATSGGVFTFTGLYQTSDGRFKTNVTENVKGLEFIKKLRPVTYNMDTKIFDDFIVQNMPDSAKTMHQAGMDFTSASAIIHSGFIAQEVEQAAQQVGYSSSIVHTPSNSADPYALSYAEIVVPLVKAVQELSKNDSIKDAKLEAIQNKIDQLDAVINSCCAIHTNKSVQQNNSNPESSVNSKDIELSNKNIIVLNQNIPNPFQDQTIINYYLPDNFTHAQIIFLEESGKLIKTVELTEKGNGQLNVFGNDLTSGIYTYSLIVDGQTIETKKMVKAK